MSLRSYQVTEMSKPVLNANDSMQANINKLDLHLLNNPDLWFNDPRGFMKKPSFKREEQMRKNIKKSTGSSFFSRMLSSAFQERYFVLNIEEQNIHYYLDSTLKEEKGVINFDDIDDVDYSTVADAPEFSIDLISEAHHFTLACGDAANMYRWALACNRCIKAEAAKAVKEVEMKAMKSETDDANGSSKSEESVECKIVQCKSYIQSLGKVDTKDEIFYCDLYVRLSWDDDYLEKVEDPTNEEQNWEDEGWYDPRLEVVNAVDLDIVNDSKFVQNGRIQREIRYRGTCNSFLDCHNFPFDRQKLEVKIESTFWGMDELVFEDSTSTSQKVGRNRNAELLKNQEFDIVDIQSAVIDHEYEHLKEDDNNSASYSQFCIGIYVKRKSGYYFVKIISIYLLVMILCWSVFFLPIDLGDRLGIISTSFLAFVAFQFAINDQIPPVPYLTKIDVLAVVCYGMVIVTNIQCCISWQLYERGSINDDNVFEIDMACLGINFAVLFLVVVWLGLSSYEIELWK